MRDLFSQRTLQVETKRDELIERWMLDHDGAEPDGRTIAQLERAAVLASRPGKTHGTDASELHATWQHQAQQIHFPLRSLTSEQFDAHLEPAIGDEAEVAVEALRRVSEEAATWLPADIARHVTTLLPPSAARSGAEVAELVDRITTLAVDRCVDLNPERDGARRRDARPILEHVTDRHLSTTLILEQEQSLQNWALSHAHRPHPQPDVDRQTEAAQMIAGTSSLVLVVGPAGTGKTRTTATAVANLQEQGRQVVGLAASGKAADVLRQEAGCPTDTLAGFLTRHRSPTPSPWPPGTTVILDEAGMAATQDLAELVGLVRRNHWRLVAVGDPAQLPSVARGGTFAHWCDTVPHHQLDTPRRFLEPWEAAASLALRQGDPDAARTYQQHGRLHTTHPTLLPHRIAQEYWEHTNAGRSVAITTSNAATARTINDAIQRTRPDLSDSGSVPGSDPDSDHRQVRLHDGSHLGIGDQIATRRNDPTLTTNLGEKVRNRQTWTIDHLHPDGTAAAAHPAHGTAILPADYVSQNVELGWAVTGYGNQGDTVDIGIAILEPGTNRSHTYVALTRGRHANHAWIPDPIGTLDPADQFATLLTTPPSRAKYVRPTAGPPRGSAGPPARAGPICRHQHRLWSAPV